ncbi:MAG TPA: hypothetical protein VLX59_01525 [Acidimicrobiales bacterium]|nr:hypothetical protein [Acidimicrobiales bacterium]
MIGAPVACPEPVLPDGVLEVELLEDDLLLEEHAPTATIMASAPTPDKSIRFRIT